MVAKISFLNTRLPFPPATIELHVDIAVSAHVNTRATTDAKIIGTNNVYSLFFRLDRDFTPPCQLAFS
jgi:hypothetical protein